MGLNFHLGEAKLLLKAPHMFYPFVWLALLTILSCFFGIKNQKGTTIFAKYDSWYIRILRVWMKTKFTETIPKDKYKTHVMFCDEKELSFLLSTSIFISINKKSQTLTQFYMLQSLGPRGCSFRSLRGSVGVQSAMEHTTIELTGRDRPGLLSEIFAVLSDLKCNIVAAEIWTHNSRMASIYITDNETTCRLKIPIDSLKSNTS